MDHSQCQDVCMYKLVVVVQHKAFSSASAFRQEVYSVEPWQEIVPSVSVSWYHVITFCDRWQASSCLSFPAELLFDHL